MNRFFTAWRLSLVLLLQLTLVACGRDSYESIRNLRSQGETIICFGDSLTEGVGAGEAEDYPAVLSRLLGLPIVNAGHRGDTTAQALRRLSQDVLGKNPRLVIVLLGGNDFLRQVPLRETKKNLEEIVRQIQARGAMVVVMGMKLGFFSDEYSPLYDELAKQFGALHVPEVLKGIMSDSKLKSDAIHPNGAGYRRIAERIAEKVKPLLDESDRQRVAAASG